MEEQEYVYPIQNYVITVKRREYITIHTLQNTFRIELLISDEVNTENLQNGLIIKGMNNILLTIVNNPQQDDCKINLQFNDNGDVNLLAQIQFAPIQLGNKLIEIGQALAGNNNLPQGFQIQNVEMALHGGSASRLETSSILRRRKRKTRARRLTQRKTRKLKHSKK
jgi:hypothetical protein